MLLIYAGTSFVILNGSEPLANYHENPTSLLGLTSVISFCTGIYDYSFAFFGGNIRLFLAPYNISLHHIRLPPVDLEQIKLINCPNKYFRHQHHQSTTCDFSCGPQPIPDQKNLGGGNLVNPKILYFQREFLDIHTIIYFVYVITNDYIII